TSRWLLPIVWNCLPDIGHTAGSIYLSIIPPLRRPPAGRAASSPSPKRHRRHRRASRCRQAYERSSPGSSMSPAEDTAAIRRRAPIRAADGAILEPEAWEIFDKVAGSVYASLPTLEAATALLARRRRNGPFFPAY